MIRFLLFLGLILSGFTINAQTTVIDLTAEGGFEDGPTFGDNGWVTNSPASASWNQWVCDTGASSGFSGTNAAYVSNNRNATIPPHTYTNNVTRVSHLYRDITFTPGESNITLSFDWIVDGESTYDYMRIWLVPQSFTPNYGTQITASGTAPTGNVQISGNFSEQYTWTNSTFQLPSNYAGVGARLVFEWRNDGSLGGNPPIGLDNISLVTDVLTSYCSVSSNYSGDYIDDFSTSVGLGSDISNLNSGFTPPGYEDNTTTQIVEQLAGGIVDFTVDFSGTFDTFGFNIWVDWNNDLDFNDTGELVYASGAYITGVADDFTIPATTTSGNYRMRIRADYFDTDPDPCGVISYGEAEDYTLTVPAITCTDDPSNITITAITETTATINWTAPSTPPPNGYAYFVSTNPSTPSFTQTPTGTTANTATNANLTGLSENTTYYVWVRSICTAGASGSGSWIGPVTFTTLANPPTVTDVSICPGDPSQNLTAMASCTNFNTTNIINGNLDIAGPYADTPPWFIVSTDPCAFDPAYNKNYDTFDFQVDTDGVYIFEIDPTLAPDFMGYIVINDPLNPFTYGSCATGTWIAGDDDSGPGLDAAITANLLAGVDYTLVTTLAFSSSQSTPYTWNVSGAGSIITGSAGTMEWYTSATGGTPIGSGANFDPVGVAGSGLPNTNTPGVYSYWAACDSSPTIRTQANFVIGKIWNGTLGNTDWNTATNWIPNGVPTATECLIIPDTGGNDPIIDSATDGLGHTLTVESGAILTQQSNSTLTITNSITIDAGGTYNILDSSSLIQVDNVANTVNGTFTMDRNTNIRANDYVYWSSPVASFNIQNVSPGTPNGYKHEWLPTLFQGVGPPGNMVFGEWQGYDSGAMDIGKGYIVKGPTGHTTTPSNYTATFSGNPNNGNIIQPIERGNHTTGTYFYQPYSGGDVLTITNDDDNWNLIGNPYPSAIDAIEFLTHTSNGNITGSVYLWTHGTDIGAGNTDPFYEDYLYNYNVADYIAYNSSGASNPTGFNGNIGAGQGFFVLMTDAATTNETVTFDNSMRSSAYSNNQFYRNSDSSQTDDSSANRIWLDFVSPSGQTNTTLVAYIDGATNSTDRMFDAPTTIGNGLNLYSLIDGETYLIQGRQLPFDINDQIPIGLNITETGIQTIAINTLEGLFNNSDQDIFVEDLLYDIIHNIKESPYTFESDLGYINDRFILRYTNTTLGIEDIDPLNGIRVFEENETIVVKSDYENIQSIEVYDILGRNLFANKSINADRFYINSIKPSEQTLFLKIKLTNGGQKIEKIIF
ncbi:GEVED domain-containing protein [Winogradskyella sp.]|uniref:GEVED domain-containing protein n=1 Tax=Winogradskyella sp. TaxID=1883156 RepID=UPI001B1464EE|nr:GEVED domain-containing protein [Winogradskyella sp.]MBO6881520.1 T9SS type A sorting domain-containing protein [Winogradskyella sp.]